MGSTVGSEDGKVHLIDHALAVADSQKALADVTAAVGAAAPDDPLGLELTGDHPTAPALQILVAAARGLAASGALAGLGPRASGALGALSIDSPARG